MVTVCICSSRFAGDKKYAVVYDSVRQVNLRAA